jgi:hypothetical protein
LLLSDPCECKTYVQATATMTTNAAKRVDVIEGCDGDGAALA